MRLHHGRHPTAIVKLSLGLLVVALLPSSSLAFRLHYHTVSPTGLSTQPVVGRKQSPVLMVHPVNERPFSARERPFSARDYLDSTKFSPMSMAQAWISAGVPRWITLVDELLFVLASLMFVAGSFDFFLGSGMFEALLLVSERHDSAHRGLSLWSS